MEKQLFPTLLRTPQGTLRTMIDILIVGNVSERLTSNLPHLTSSQVTFHSDCGQMLWHGRRKDAAAPEKEAVKVTVSLSRSLGTRNSA
jgi:hypothetical protein